MQPEAAGLLGVSGMQLGGGVRTCPIHGVRGSIRAELTDFRVDMMRVQLWSKAWVWMRACTWPSPKSGKLYVDLAFLPCMIDNTTSNHTARLQPLHCPSTTCHRALPLSTPLARLLHPRRPPALPFRPK